ncbi:MAG: hypothetical protein CVU00_10175 [Bacteroidetes bacterium HGW-Bacteroidetes-17]|nr:MAG: hypothetical protein CVU00_10175 [Bacteroidetes bacterium HGW-Bacteroidetes-17]
MTADRFCQVYFSKPKIEFSFIDPSAYGIPAWPQVRSPKNRGENLETQMQSSRNFKIKVQF